MESKTPTIKEIARRLNVSISTVSRALSDHPRIGLRTKMRVKELVRELNYEPNTQAIFFKQKRTFVIGVVLPFIREEFFSQAISGIESAAMEHEYTILFGQSYDDPGQEKKVVETMRKQRIDGLIISLSKHTTNYSHLAALEQYGIPVIYFDRIPPMQNVHRVYCNVYKGTLDLVHWLFRRGYKRIGLINGPAKMQASKERLNGYIEGVSRKKTKVDMQLVESTDFSKEATIKAMKQLLKQKRPPNAIISFNDYVHMDAVQYAHSVNVRVNDDIAFVSYANLSITGYTAFPPLVSLEQYPFEQGRQAMNIIIKVLEQRSENEAAPLAYQTEEIIPTLIALQQVRPTRISNSSVFAHV